MKREHEKLSNAQGMTKAMSGVADLTTPSPIGPIDWTMIFTWSVIFVVGGVATALALRVLSRL